MRQRLARWTAPKAAQSAVLEPLFAVVRQNHPKADLAVIESAFRTAEHYHSGQTRKSGDAYITHPLAVATILAELGMTETTLCAALLHDTVEDTPYTLAQLESDFGPEVARLVDGVTKLDKVTYGESTQAESIRKMVIAMARDIRVVVIKLADRLHNMRTLGSLRPDKQNRIARETLDIYAPLAHRLGMNTIKWELEDLAFSTMQPKLYDEIVQLVAQEQPARERMLSEIIAEASAALAAEGLKAEIYGRPKHYYSIYQKMVVRGRDFQDIYDLVGLRVLVETKGDCYTALGVLHDRWKPLPNRFKDYIATPKFNTYESLHTTVVGPNGKPVEFQIRTYDMHRRAEYGVAAHWKYKQAVNGTRVAKAGTDLIDLQWVQRLQAWQQEERDPGEFLDSLMYDLSSRDVMVFTPKGDLMSLPQGATPVDFAYAVHTEVGHHCIGARVNERLVRLDTELKDGDMVDVLTSRSADAGPSRDWLDFVTSPRAKQKIRQYFTRERRDTAIELGKEALARQLRKSGMPLQRVLTIQHLTAVANDLRIGDVESLYASIGEGNVGAQNVVQRLIGLEGGAEQAAEEAAEDRPIYRTHRARTTDTGIEVHGDSGLWVKLARCCTPVPGDPIIGFVTRGQGVSVHRKDCTNAANLTRSPERLVDVSWATDIEASYLVSVSIEGLDRAGLLADITATLAEEKVSIRSAQLQTSKGRTFHATITFEIPDPSYLRHVLSRLRRIREVTDVRRVSA